MFDLHFDPQALVNVLPVLGKGILGVFAVICAIRKAAGDCVMPREGIFVKVLKEGSVRPGDELEIIK